MNKYIFIAFITESQLQSTHLTQDRFLWLSLTILNYINSAWGKIKFHGFYCELSIESILPEAGRIFVAFTVDF